MIKHEICILDTKYNIKTIKNNKNNFFIVETPVEGWKYSINQILKKNPKIGIYILISEEDKQVYVGQSVNFYSRITDHIKDKDWIEKIIFIAPESANTPFNKTELDFYEKTLIEEFTLRTEFQVQNNNNGNNFELSSLKEIELDDAYMELTGMLGFIFNFSNEVKEERFAQIVVDGLIPVYMNVNGTRYESELDMNQRKIRAIAGTTFTIDFNTHKYPEKMQRTINSGAIELVSGNVYRISKDMWVTPSYMSDMITGKSTNGWDWWKQSNNSRTINDLRKM